MAKSKAARKKRPTRAEKNAAFVQELRRQAAELNGSNRAALEKQMAVDEMRCREITYAGLPAKPSRKQAAEMDAAKRILRQVGALKRSVESGELWPAVESAFFWGYFFSKKKVARETSHVEAAIDGLERGNAAKSAKAIEHAEWARTEYAAILTRDTSDTKGAKKRVLEAFPIKFPHDKPPKISTIKEWVRTPRVSKRNRAK